MVNLGIKCKEAKVTTTWLSGGNCDYSRKLIIMVIPSEFATDYNLDKPTSILVTPMDNGLLKQKLEVANQ
jgi:hypothetical protein